MDAHAALERHPAQAAGEQPRLHRRGVRLETPALIVTGDPERAAIGPAEPLEGVDPVRSHVSHRPLPGAVLGRRVATHSQPAWV